MNTGTPGDIQVQIERTPFPKSNKGEFTEVSMSKPRAGEVGKNPEADTYSISKIDRRDKESFGYGNCTFVIGFGVDKATHEHISFLTHQNPNFFLKGGRAQFLGDLEATLQQFIERTEEEGRKIMIGGGNYAEKFHVFMRNKYRKSIHLLSETILRACSVEPPVIIGPNTAYGKMDVRVLTKEQKVVLSRSEQPNPHSDKSMSINEALSLFPLKVAGVLSVTRNGIQTKLREVLLGD